MRLNKFIANNTQYSRRSADVLIEQGRVRINHVTASVTSEFTSDDDIYLDNIKISIKNIEPVVVLLNKPEGYVCSKYGQGSKTIYSLLPAQYQDLNIAGRLDKDSSGLVVLTNDGDLLYKLTHPSQEKLKVYEAYLNKPLTKFDWQTIHENGVILKDGPSKLFLERLQEDNEKKWQISMHEGRNRQIRRTFGALGYRVVKLRRTQLANYNLANIKTGQMLHI